MGESALSSVVCPRPLGGEACFQRAADLQCLSLCPLVLCAVWSAGRASQHPARFQVLAYLGRLWPSLPPPSQTVLWAHLGHGAISCASFWNNSSLVFVPTFGLGLRLQLSLSIASLWAFHAGVFFLMLSFHFVWPGLALLFGFTFLFAWYGIVFGIRYSAARLGIALGRFMLSRRRFSTFCERGGRGQCR